MKFHAVMPKIEMTGVKFQSGLVGEISRLTRNFMNQRTAILSGAAEYKKAALTANRDRLQSMIRPLADDEPPQAA